MRGDTQSAHAVLAQPRGREEHGVAGADPDRAPAHPAVSLAQARGEQRSRATLGPSAPGMGESRGYYHFTRCDTGCGQPRAFNTPVHVGSFLRWCR
ncbi:hypothetical protein Lesp02_22870 [Lentzea sp. NBRC 105346]|nr:hypothetical protein Lesp02_22870 [Lentzea sp. NBRC 105346]